MINLIIEKKCENCPCFEVTQRSADFTNIGDECWNYLHELTCKNYDFCRQLEEYLREVIENERDGKTV